MSGNSQGGCCMMDRTVYLNERKGIRVRRDGPSLWIEERGRAGRRVPLRLIGQVVIRGNIRLDSGVITMLAAEGIPVTFLSAGEDPVVALPADTDRARLRGRVERFRRSRRGVEAVRQLFCARKRTLETGLIRRLLPEAAALVGEKGLRERDYHAIVDFLVDRAGGRAAVRAARPVIRGLFHELVLRMVLDEGFDPHRGFFEGGRDFSLVKDILFAVSSEMDRQAIRFARSRALERFVSGTDDRRRLTHEGYRNIVVRFENARGRTERVVGSLLDDFLDLLRRTVL